VSTDPLFGLRPINPKPLEPVDSGDSFFVQAADIAAGIVTALWNRSTLAEVVRTFDYVTYNGRRIGESEAETITAKNGDGSSLRAAQ